MSAKLKGVAAQIQLPAVFPDRTLDTARVALRAQLETGKKVICPCCAQDAKIYARKFRGDWLKALRLLAENTYMSPRDLVRLTGSRDYPSITYFDGLAHVGPNKLWRISNHGRAFLRGEVTIPMYALIYNGEVLGGAEGQQTLHISDLYDADDDGFSLNELMNPLTMITAIEGPQLAPAT